MNKCYIIAIACIISVGALKAQNNELKYKDVFSTIQNAPDEKAYEQLQKHQKQDPFHANTYYQLGKIAQKWIANYDPLTDYENLSFFTYHANLYYNLCKKYLDEKETKKNGSYYQDVKPLEGNKRVEHQQFVDDVSKKIKEVEYLVENVNKIRASYFGAVRNYSKSLNTFTDIVEKNAKLKDIYLTADAPLIKDIQNVGVHFDSALIYFDKYKQAIATFPIKNYNQNYELKPIETYRLEGLIKSNFLKNEITLWDYRTWVNEVLSVIDNGINEMRYDIDVENKKIESLTNVIELIQDYSNAYGYYELDEKLAFRIGRYDFQPFILDMFNYKVAKLNLLIDTKKTFNNPNQKEVNFRNKLLFYKEFIEKKQDCDQLIKSFSAKATDFNMQKYQGFITTNYKTTKGLQTYISSQSNKLESLLDLSMENLKIYMVNSNQAKYTHNKTIPLKKGEVSLTILHDPLVGDSINYYYTSSKVKTSHGDWLVAGYYHPTEKNTKAFVAKCDSLYALKWFKEFDFSDKKTKIENFACQIKATDNGCVVMIHGRNTNSDQILYKNWVVKLGSDGNEEAKFELDQQRVPRKFYYDEITASFIGIFKGQHLSLQAAKMDTMVVQQNDSLGNKVWDVALAFEGLPVNLIRSNEMYLLACNFTKINHATTQLVLPDNQSGAFLALINQRGNIDKLITYNEKFSYFFIDAIKLDSETINLVGLKSDETNLENKTHLLNSKIRYQLIDTKGNTIYKY